MRLKMCTDSFCRLAIPSDLRYSNNLSIRSLAFCYGDIIEGSPLFATYITANSYASGAAAIVYIANLMNPSRNKSLKFISKNLCIRLNAKL